MSKKKLFDDDSEEDIELKTENEYAKKYDNWREKEELHKLEQKYGSDILKTDGAESDSEDESDAPPEVSEEVEEQFLKTLALLKTKDPRIYDPNFKCFDQEEEKKSEEKAKPKTLTFDDSDDDDDDGDIFKIEKKAEIDEDDTQIDKSNEAPKKKKEKKIKEYLTGKAEHIDEEVERDLAPLKALWSDPKLNEGEAFLRDYILNKRYLDDEDEVGEAADRLRDDDDLEADEQTVEEQSKFERAYNFRFEEPDDEYLKRFPRTMNSIRPKDDRRSRKRAEVRARKDDEKTRKMEEIARLKALKLKEIQEKIARIKEVTGNEELAFKEEDIEGDFDPEEHDRRMRAMFDEEYYGEADNEKPVFPDLDEELEIENWDKYEQEHDVEQSDTQGNEGPHCEDEDFNMDADYNPRANLLATIQQSLGKKRRNRKRKSKLAEVLTVEKPKFLPDADKTYDQYMEEYYKMDCEDVVGGDLPTRFKYREVVPNDYGLTVEEILLADDRELTQWVPLKRIVKHRPETVEKGEVKTYAQRAADARLKRKMLPSLFQELPEEPEIVVPAGEGAKKKKKKKKNKEKNTEEHDEQNDAEAPEHDIEDDGQAEVKQKKKEKREQNDVETPEQDLENERQSEVKQKKRKKSSVEVNTIEEEVQNRNETIGQEVNSSIKGQGKRKKKRKTSENSNIPKQESNVEEVATDITLPEIKKSKKKKKPKQIEINGDNVKSNNRNLLENVSTKFAEQKNNHTAGGFVVEEVTTQGPSQESSVNTKGRSNNFHKNETRPGKGVKRKSEAHIDPTQQKKKKQDINNRSKGKKAFTAKFNQKDKAKNKKFNNKQINDASNDNPLSKLSDERLKAYGLNPKKYKNFLKYKKF